LYVLIIFWYILSSYLEFLQTLEKRIDQDWADISSSLEEIRKTVFSKQGCLINITADGKNLANTDKFVSKFVDMLPTSSPIAATNIWNVRLPLTNEAIVIPTQVRLFQLLSFAYIIFK
jgi:Zn-dependent M16 (insulinase) family peptidase